MSVLEAFSLAGKVAVVTGGAGLYGAPFCKALAEAGATVVLTSRTQERADRAVALLRGQGLSAVARVLDLTDESSVDSLRDRVSTDFGRIDILVNNAVHRQGRGLVDTTAADWSATSLVNSRGLFLISRAVSNIMRSQRSGSIINIGSIYGMVGPDFAVYNGTEMTMPAFYAFDKAGMIGLTRYMACCLGPDGIRVNCLCPGGLLEEDHPRSTFVSQYESRTPLGRMASYDDPTGPLVFLASDAARYVTGAVLPVDGGWTTH